jgi:FMN phosphatase YigB (HAD superfamily)
VATQHLESSRDEFLVAIRMRDASRPAVRTPQCPLAATRAIRGLLLEAGNILYDDTAWRRWLLRLLMRLGLRTEYGPFFRVFDRDFLEEVHCGRKTFDEAMNAFLVAAGLSAGQADEACRALNSHRHRSEAEYRPIIGVRETLTQLHTLGMTLGILCNSERSGSVLRQRLSELLGDLPWKTIVSSRDLACAMPAAACYRSALDAVKLPAADVAFVGRDPRELRGAKAHGLTTIAFNADADARADIYLQRFEDLLDLVRFSPPHSAAA